MRRGCGDGTGRGEGRRDVREPDRERGEIKPSAKSLSASATIAASASGRPGPVGLNIRFMSLMPCLKDIKPSAKLFGSAISRVYLL
jgi:hypothetical protein